MDQIDLKRVIDFVDDTGFTPCNSQYYKNNGPVLTPIEIMAYGQIKHDLLFELADIDKKAEPGRTQNITDHFQYQCDQFTSRSDDYYETCLWLALTRKGTAKAQRDVANNVYQSMSLLFTHMTVIVGRMKYLNTLTKQPSLFG